MQLGRIGWQMGWGEPDEPRLANPELATSVRQQAFEPVFCRDIIGLDDARRNSCEELVGELSARLDDDANRARTIFIDGFGEVLITSVAAKLVAMFGVKQTHGTRIIAEAFFRDMLDQSSNGWRRTRRAGQRFSDSFAMFAPAARREGFDL